MRTQPKRWNVQDLAELQRIVEANVVGNRIDWRSVQTDKEYKDFLAKTGRSHRSASSMYYYRFQRGTNRFRVRWTKSARTRHHKPDQSVPVQNGPPTPAMQVRYCPCCGLNLSKLAIS